MPLSAQLGPYWNAEHTSIPPSLVVLTMLLQYYDDCSDAEAEARLRFDLRWKHALGLRLEDDGFDATVLCHFRRKLLERSGPPKSRVSSRGRRLCGCVPTATSCPLPRNLSGRRPCSHLPCRTKSKHDRRSFRPRID